MQRLFLVTICLSIPFSALGQPDKGTLKDTEFVIEKERKNLLQEASRLFEAAPGTPRAATPLQPLSATSPTIFPTFVPLTRKVKLLRAKQDVVSQHYGNYLQAGHGNFYTPYLEGFFTNPFHPAYAHGLHMKHLSSGRKFWGEATHHLIELYGKVFKETLWLGWEVGYQRDNYPFYGPSASSVQQNQGIHQFVLRGTGGNHTESDLDYQVDTAFQYVTTADASEKHGEIQGQVAYTWKDDLKLEAIADLHFIQNSASTPDLYRVQLTPVFVLHDFDVQGGVNLVYHDDLKVYPVLKIKYPLYPWLRPYIGIEGNVQPNTLQSLLQETPWLAPDTAISHTEHDFLFCGGAEGNLLEQISFHGGLSAGKYKNLPFFVKSSATSSQFTVEYAPDTTLLNAFAELAHVNEDESWSNHFRGDYFQYNLQKPKRPWYRPRYQLDYSSTYRWHDKLILKGNICYLEGLEALSEEGQVQALEDVLDVNLDIDYCWNARFSIFFQCKHLLGQQRDQYLHHPIGGPHFIAGLAYAW